MQKMWTFLAYWGVFVPPRSPTAYGPGTPQYRWNIPSYHLVPCRLTADKPFCCVVLPVTCIVNEMALEISSKTKAEPKSLLFAVQQCNVSSLTNLISANESIDVEYRME